MLENYDYPLSLKQMRYIFVLCTKLANTLNCDREELREELKLTFCEKENIRYFSCSPYEPDSITLENASKFINFIKDIAQENGITI